MFFLKYSRWVRWLHWLNFPILALMVWSGTLIYWANDVYRPFFPKWIYQTFHLHHRLALGMAVHFAVMWLFALNGFLYGLYLVVSGEWKFYRLNRRSFQDAWDYLLTDLGLRKSAPTSENYSDPAIYNKYNPTQKLAYLGVLGMGLFSILTGLAIYKPVQLNWLTSFFGGYEGARLIHFILYLGFGAFFIVHLIQVGRAGWNSLRAMMTGYEGNNHEGVSNAATPIWLKKRTLKSIAVGALCTGIGVFGWNWVMNQPQELGISAPLRRVLEKNGKLGQRFLSLTRIGTIPPAPPTGKSVRLNGALGLQEQVDFKNWQLIVESPSSPEVGPQKLHLSLDQLKWLPKTETTTEFKCIEGWSEVFSYGGIRFRDFLIHYQLGSRNPQVRQTGWRTEDLYRYVGFETPDGEYYVSIDMESLLHPQTLLVYEMNGVPLSPEHGAPLRLIIPIKYGIKSLKRIGTLYFSDTRPPDYWAERGYDWFAGL